MNRTVLFLAATLAGGWMFQTVFLYLAPAALPTPHWCLLAVLALAGRGRAGTAMTAGYLWGLALDVYGVTAFGSQAWLLALTGWAAAGLSKKVDADKIWSQAVSALLGTALVMTGVVILTGLFHPTAPSGRLRWGGALAGLALNTMCAPAVFWVVDSWCRWWGLPRVADHV